MVLTVILRIGFALLLALVSQPPAQAGTLKADPKARPGDSRYYRKLAKQLRAGDKLLLPAGTYGERLDLQGINGREGAWITVTGPESGAPAVITTQSTCCNTVLLGNTSYVAIRNLTVDSNTEALGASLDGIKAKGGPTHHILVENCIIRGQSYDQQTVGISTKSTAWNWIVRGNTVIRPGTGMYLGNSDGSAPFIAGLIERNLVIDPIGYCMEIKYQRPYSSSAGMPAGPNRTIVRDNVFIKRIPQGDWPRMPDGRTRVSGPRPNLLVGGFPDSGPGSPDLYEIYRNFFYGNPDESLLQASGRAVIHDNIFAGKVGTAIRLQHHDLPLKLARIFNNTIYGAGVGIRFENEAMEDSDVIGNLVFAGSGIVGPAGRNAGNIVDTVENAAAYVTAPSLHLGEMDFYPLTDRCSGTALHLSRFSGYDGYDRDFNGTPKAPFLYRGAYAGAGSNPGWRLSESLKPPIR